MWSHPAKSVLQLKVKLGYHQGGLHHVACPSGEGGMEPKDAPSDRCGFCAGTWGRGRREPLPVPQSVKMMISPHVHPSKTSAEVAVAPF